MIKDGRMNVLNKRFDLEMLSLSHRLLFVSHTLLRAITKTIFLSKRQAFTFSLHFEMRLDEEFIVLLFSLLQWMTVWGNAMWSHITSNYNRMTNYTERYLSFPRIFSNTMLGYSLKLQTIHFPLEIICI